MCDKNVKCTIRGFGLYKVGMLIMQKGFVFFAKILLCYLGATWPEKNFKSQVYVFTADIWGVKIQSKVVLENKKCLLCKWSTLFKFF